MFTEHLRDRLGLRCDPVSMHEPLTNIRKLIVIICERSIPTTEIWRAMYGAASLHRAAGKYVIAVNDDIDPNNADIFGDGLSRKPGAGCQNFEAWTRAWTHGSRAGSGDASVLFDATLKEDFPPISLPKKNTWKMRKKYGTSLGAGSDRRYLGTDIR